MCTLGYSSYNVTRVPVAQWISTVTLNMKVDGSNPGEGNIFLTLCFHSRSGGLCPYKTAV